MDTGFANGDVVGDSHTAQGSISSLSDIYIYIYSAQCKDIRRRLTHDNQGPLILEYHLLPSSIDAYFLFHLKYFNIVFPFLQRRRHFIDV